MTYETLLINGQPSPRSSAVIAAEDRGLLLGHAVFETVRAQFGQLHCFSAHWQRLQMGMEMLAIVPPFDEEGCKQLLLQALQANKACEAEKVGLRLTVTAGCAARGLLPQQHFTATTLVSCFAISTQTAQPIRCHLSRFPKNHLSPLSKIKTTDYVESIVAKREASAAGAEEALFLNVHGHLTEATVANLFLVSKKRLLTPRIEDGILPGVTRAEILTVASELGIETVVTSLDVKELHSADEVFLSKTSIPILPVQAIDNQQYKAPGAITQRLSARLNSIA